jgi:hypothetical protein
LGLVVVGGQGTGPEVSLHKQARSLSGFGDLGLVVVAGHATGPEVSLHEQARSLAGFGDLGLVVVGADPAGPFTLVLSFMIDLLFLSVSGVCRSLSVHAPTIEEKYHSRRSFLSLFFGHLHDDRMRSRS